MELDGPLYGEHLAHFPEVFSDYDILSYDKIVTGGLTNERVVIKGIRAYLTRNRGGKMGVENNNRTANQISSFYVDGDNIPEGKIAQGLYVKERSELYVFMQDNGYAKEGDFHVYLLQLVPGNNGKQKPTQNVNIGINEFE